ELVEIDLDVVGDRVSGWQALGLDLREAAGAVELDDPHPVRVGRERVLGVAQRLVDLARVALVDLARRLVAPARGAEGVIAVAAARALAVECEVEVLRDSDAGHQLASKIALLNPSMRTLQPCGTVQVLVSDSSRVGPWACAPGVSSSHTSRSPLTSLGCSSS